MFRGVDVVWCGGGTKIGNGLRVSTVPLCYEENRGCIIVIGCLCCRKIKDDNSTEADPAPGQLTVLSLNSGRKMVNK